MNMKRKFIALLLGALLALPQVSFGTELSESSVLKSIIESVKKKISVSDELSNFSYYALDEMYQLSWNDEESGESVNMRVEADGDILYYHHYEDKNYSILAEVDYQEAKANAEAFLKQVAPDYAKLLVLQESSAPSRDNTYTFRYDLVQDGIKVLGETVLVSVDKQTGTVVGFNGISYDKGRTYVGKTPKVSLEAAEALYLDKIGIELAYQTRYDYQKKERSSFLAYDVDNVDYKGIHATTGEIVELLQGQDDDIEPRAAKSESSNDIGAAGSGEVSLTPAEQKAVDETKNVLSAEELKAMWEPYFSVLSTMEMTSSRLYQGDKTYYRNIICRKNIGADNEEHVSLYVDAMTGELWGYDYSVVDQKEDIGTSWTQKEADTFIQKIAPDTFKKVVFNEMSESQYDESQQYFSYRRVENGIPVAGDGINLTYNKALDMVTSYHKNLTDTTFKKPQGILTEQEVVKNIGLELVYMETADQYYELAYNHETSSMLLDAFSGKAVSYYGDEKKEDVQGIYTDIKGHPQEAIITKLFNSGIYLNTSRLNPDSPITQKEMISLLIQARRGTGVSEEDLYKEACELGIIEESEKNPTKQMIREDAIGYLINLTDFKKVATLSEIYNYPFKDESVSETRKGAIAIAYGLGLLDKEDYFKPKDTLTKAEAMVYVYRLIESNYGD